MPGCQTCFGQIADALVQIALLELARREIDRQHFERQTGVQPGFHARTGRAQDPFAERYDQAGFFRQGNEATGGEETHTGDLPTYQGFHAEYPAVRQRHQRLIMQDEFILLQRGAAGFRGRAARWRMWSATRYRSGRCL